MTEACYGCMRNAEDPAVDPAEHVHQDDHWRLATAFDSSLPGWLILLPRRHLTGLHELTAGEADGLGRLLHRASAALVEVTGCAKTYVMLFAEAEGFAHLHFHVVPRSVDLPPEQRGPGVFARLGADAEHRVGSAERLALAERIGDAMARRPPATGRAVRT